jgi:hypothetical protein
VDASGYRRALAQAETAIAKDRVPAHLRAYVREYFVAIRPQSAP